MKQLIFIVSLICCTLTLYAQADSSKTNPVNKNNNSNKQAVPQEQRSYSIKGMVQVSPKEISNGLKRRLVSAQYSGWEKGTLYFDKKTKEYALLMPEGKDPMDSVERNTEMMGKKTAHTGWYYFTYDGSPISK